MTDSNYTLPFTKMQGAGNDFVILDNRELGLSDEEIAELAPSVCTRKYGVGADGIMALTPAREEAVDYTMIYRNPDGSNAGMCGNGARCMALFAYSLGFEVQHAFNVHDQVYEAHIKGENAVTISFPMQASAKEIQVEGQQVYQIHTGTEHIVLPVEPEELNKEGELRNRGKALRYHSRFQPKGTNVNFISGKEPNALKLQTYERGVEGLTLACGTGAIASALIWHELQEQDAGDHIYTVETEGGILKVHFSFDADTQTYSQIKLEGPAHFVFTGEFLR